MKNDGQSLTIRADNLSIAWAKVMAALLQPGVTRITPLTLIIDGLEGHACAPETPGIRKAVDIFLEAQEKRDTENVAWTIFPQRYWELSGGDRELFFELFNDSFARVQEFNPRNNRRGSYFQRLVDLHGEGRGPNQLKWMLDEYEGHPKARRTSKFQATTFDPLRDYTSSGQLEFPCLQQVSFTFDDGLLQLNAFYATQQIARKGYGNYLGLCRLGAFIADQTGLKLDRLNVFVGVAKMDVKKSDPALTSLLEAIAPYMNNEARAA